MDILQMAMTGLQIGSALLVIILVLMQEENDRGLGTISGGAETFFSKNTASNPKSQLRRGTIWMALAFALCTVALGIASNIL